MYGRKLKILLSNLLLLISVISLLLCLVKEINSWWHILYITHNTSLSIYLYICIDNVTSIISKKFYILYKKFLSYSFCNKEFSRVKKNW